MVAVKIVTHDRTLATLAETLRESALSTSIQHPNVVRIHLACTYPGCCSSCFVPPGQPCQVCSQDIPGQLAMWPTGADVSLCDEDRSEHMRACALQVTTFKVRTIRSQGGSTDQASASRTWTTAEDGSLDAAAGGHDQLLARAMSIAGAGRCTSCSQSPIWPCLLGLSHV